MYVIAQHQVSDPATFFSIAGAAASDLPAHLRLHCVLPSLDGGRAVCLWEADSVAAIREFVEPAVGHLSSNVYFEVDAPRAVGLPRLENAA